MVMFFCNQSSHVPQFVIALLIGFTICSIAIVTPAWQVTVVPELNMTIQHGLWMSCQKRMHGIFVCLYSFAEQDDYNKTVTRELSVFSPIFTVYQHVVLGLFICAQLLTFLCIILYILSRYQHLHSYMSFFYDIGVISAAVFCAAGCIIFAVFTHLDKYNSFDGETSTRKFQLQLRMSRSISFYVMIVGTFFYFVAFISSILHHIRSLKRSRMLPNSTYSPEVRRLARKNTLGSAADQRTDGGDDDTFSKPPARKVTPHPRQNSTISSSSIL